MGRSQTETKALLKAIEKRRKAGRANFGTIDLLPSRPAPGPIRRTRRHAATTHPTRSTPSSTPTPTCSRSASRSCPAPGCRRPSNNAPTGSPPISGTTANTLFEDYLDEGDLKQGTIDLYRYQWHRFIEPSIGAQAVAELTATDVADWRAQLPPGSRQREQTEDLLRAVLGLAIERRLINFNPAARTRRKRKGRNTRAKARDTILLSPAEVAALAKAMPPERSFAVLISAWCGLRQGEMFALRRSDLNIQPKRRRPHQLPRPCSSPGPWSDPNNPTARSWRSKTTPNPTPGSAASRSHPTSSGDLDNHLDRFAQTGDDGLLFPNTSGGYLHPSTLYGEQPGTKRPDSRRANPSKGSGFYRARAAIGQPNLTWHALRHHAVTRAVYAGATQAELLERYGHSSIASSAIYQHADQGRDHQIAQHMSQLALQQPA